MPVLIRKIHNVYEVRRNLLHHRNSQNLRRCYPSGDVDVLDSFCDDSGERAFPFNDYIYDPTDCLIIGNSIFNKLLSRKISPASFLMFGLLQEGSKFNEETLLPEYSSFVDSNSGYGRISYKKNEVLTVWMRAGHYGFPPEFAHSHSDLLSPIINIAGTPVITEVGTYRYNTFTEDRLNDVLCEGHSGIRYDLHEQNVWSNIFRWDGKPFDAKMTYENDILSGSIITPDQCMIERQIVVNDRIVINDKIRLNDDAERLIEWSFIIDGKLKEEIEDNQNFILIFIINGSKSCLEILREKNGGTNYKLEICKLATEYGILHEGSRLIFRKIVKRNGTWSTHINIT